MNKSYVFLDIDGVVNTLMVDTTPFPTDRGQISRDGFYYELCGPEDLAVSNRQAVMWLNRLCKETNADIIISSVWRLHGLEAVEQSLRNSGLLDEIKIVGATPRLHTIGIRGDEIRLYLSEHPEVKNFVIIDDDSDMGEFVNKLVQTNVHVGFTYNDYLKALQILKN